MHPGQKRGKCGEQTGTPGKVNGRPHLVPLALQALAILKDLHPLT